MLITSESPTQNPTLDPKTLTCDIAIVGGNLVGATLACALKQSGLKIVIIESQPKTVATSQKRAYALTLLSSRIFQGIGVWSKILPQVCTFRQIRLSDGTDPRVVHFYPTDLGLEDLGYVGEHGVILSALQEFLADCDHIQWLCPATVTHVDYQSKQAVITTEVAGVTNPMSIQTQLVVAADGAKSPLRTTAGINTRGWKYWQSCITTTFKAEKHNNIAFERFWSSGPMGLLPLPNQRYQVVLTAPHAQARAWQAISQKDFEALLEERTEGLLGRIQVDGERFVFPVQLMQSDHYTRHRLALVGDAAHCCHPVGGQGLNMGIRDIAALAEVLQKAHQQGEDIGEIEVLQRYQQWRRGENLAILGFTDFLDRVFSTQFLPVVIVRRWGLWVMERVPRMKVLALKLMTGLLGRTPELGREGERGGAGAGERI